MPTFEWLKIKEREPKEIQRKSRSSSIISGLFHEKRMHDICMLLNARNILEWPVLSVNLAAAILQK